MENLILNNALPKFHIKWEIWFYIRWDFDFKQYFPENLCKNIDIFAGIHGNVRYWQQTPIVFLLVFILSINLLSVFVILFWNSPIFPYLDDICCTTLNIPFHKRFNNYFYVDIEAAKSIGIRPSKAPLLPWPATFPAQSSWFKG